MSSALCHLGETSRDVLFWLKIGVLKESRFHGMMKIVTVLALLPILAKGQGNTTTATTETTTTFPVCPEYGEPKWFQPATSTSSDFNVPALIPFAGAMDPDGKMWVYGGKDDLDTEYAWPWFNHLYYLDTKARAWHLVRPHKENRISRDGASMVIVDGNPWIFGGRIAPPYLSLVGGVHWPIHWGFRACLRCPERRVLRGKTPFGGLANYHLSSHCCAKGWQDVAFWWHHDPGQGRGVDIVAKQRLLFGHRCHHCECGWLWNRMGRNYWVRGRRPIFRRQATPNVRSLSCYRTRWKDVGLWWPCCRVNIWRSHARPARFQLGDTRLDTGRPYTSWSLPFPVPAQRCLLGLQDVDLWRVCWRNCWRCRRDSQDVAFLWHPNWNVGKCGLYWRSRQFDSAPWCHGVQWHVNLWRLWHWWCQVRCPLPWNHFDHHHHDHSIHDHHDH